MGAGYIGREAEGNKGVGNLGQAQQEGFYFLVYCPLRKLLHEPTISLHTGMISLHDGKSLGGNLKREDG